MNRRNFIQLSALASLSISFTSIFRSGITHILTLSFDDGFKISFYKIAEIHENYGLKACLNVIARGHMKNFDTEDPQWIKQDLVGDFDDWNILKQRGHEVMPHSWAHLNLTEMPIKKAKENIDKLKHY